MLAAAERERELQRQLLQAQLRLEQQAESAAATPVLALPAPPGVASAAQHAAHGLQQQAEAQAAALATAQQQLQAQAAELLLLRQQLKAAQDRADAAAAAAAAAVPAASGSNAAAAATAGAADAPQHLSGVSQQQQEQQQPPPSLEVSGVSGISLEPELLSGLPSPLGRMPPSFGSGASFWLGSARALGGNELPAAAAATTGASGHVAAGAAGRYGDTSAAAVAAGGALRGNGAEDVHALDPESPRSNRAIPGSRMRGVVTFAGRPLSASADAALATNGSGSPGRPEVGSSSGPALSSSVAALAAHVLGCRHQHQQQRSHLSSLRSSLESANLLLLGSSAVQSPRRRQQQQQGLGDRALDSSRGALLVLDHAVGLGNCIECIEQYFKSLPFIL